MARRVQRFADLHFQQFTQAVFEQRYLAVRVDHRMGGGEERIELRPWAQAQHRKRQGRQWQAKHRVQGGQLLFAHGPCLGRGRFAQARDDLDALVRGDGGVAIDQ